MKNIEDLGKWEFVKNIKPISYFLIGVSTPPTNKYSTPNLGTFGQVVYFNGFFEFQSI